LSIISDFDFDPVFKRVPQLRGIDCSKVQIRKLTGYTNHNYRLQIGVQDWVLRIPKPETNQYINRNFEAHNVSIAETLELAPKCTWRDKSGLSLTRTLKNTRPISLADFGRESITSQLIAIISRLHNCEEIFQGSVDLASLLDRYYQLVPDFHRRLVSELYLAAHTRANKLLTSDDRLRPSHNDLVRENILIDDTDRIWIIDWEYSSMSSPYWDLATMCNSLGLNRERSGELLFRYEQETAASKQALLIDYRFVLQVLSICWMAAFTATDISKQVQMLSSDPCFENWQPDDLNPALI
jgi:thiamine kinase-like enzyme